MFEGLTSAEQKQLQKRIAYWKLKGKKNPTYTALLEYRTQIVSEMKSVFKQLGI